MIENLKSLPVLPGQNILLAISDSQETMNLDSYFTNIYMVTGITLLTIEIAYSLSVNGIASIDLDTDDDNGIRLFCYIENGYYYDRNMSKWTRPFTTAWVKPFTLDGKPITRGSIDMPRLEDFANLAT
jgi:hypothetical protein